MTGLVATIGPPWYLVAPYKQEGGEALLIAMLYVHKVAGGADRHTA